MALSPGSNDRWSKTLTKRFLKAELKAGRSPRDIADQTGCSLNTVRDYLVLHNIVQVTGLPSTLVSDYENVGSITAVADRHDVSFSTARR